MHSIVYVKDYDVKNKRLNICILAYNKLGSLYIEFHINYSSWSKALMLMYQFIPYKNFRLFLSWHPFIVKVTFVCLLFLLVVFCFPPKHLKHWSLIQC